MYSNYCFTIFNYCFIIMMKEGNHMRNSILSLIKFITWIVEIICIFGIIALVIIDGFILFHGNSFVSSTGITGMGNNLSLIILSVLLEAVLFGTVAYSVRYIRLVIENIKRKIYFNHANLKLIKSTLISVGVFTVVSIVESIVIGFANANVSSVYSLKFNFTDAMFSLVVLGILYVIYLVFKNGLALQDDQNHII